MPRDVSSTLQDAIDNPGSFSFISKATLYPSYVFFETIDDDDPVPSPDATGVLDNPLLQDIAYNAATGLVTFYSDGGVLKYAVQGNGTPVVTSYDSDCKPGVIAGKLYLFDGANVRRYSIDWGDVSSLSTTPLTLEETIAVTNVRALHGISATECAAIREDDGGFRIAYIDDTTVISSTTRFMFPSVVDWTGSTRTMLSLATYSTASRLGDRLFIYMSSAYNGVATGMYYDMETETWSDTFTAVPTDLSVSMCEFRISNSFVRNNKIYMVGLLNRTDAYTGSLPYTLILGSTDGRTFSIDRFCMVTNLGYRFLATVGSDDYLYIANCNRVSKKLSTWVFDGDDSTTSPQTSLTMGNIVRYQVSADLSSMSMELKGGDEGYVDHPHIVEGSRIILEVGYKTSVGDEYVDYCSFIVDTITFDRVKGGRSFNINCIHEGAWKSQGLSMPFYAEISGVSSTYDSMNTDTGIMYSAPSNARYQYHFWVDFWNSEAYVNADEGIIGQDIANGGGVDIVYGAGAHKIGFALSSDVSHIIGSGTNPEITGTSILVKIYGWGSPDNVGSPNDTVNLILIHTDADGEDEQTIITTETKRFPISYPYQAAGDAPIEITVTGLTAGRLIKNVGLVLENTVSCSTYPWRVEFTNNVKVPVVLSDVGVTWTKNDDGTFSIPGAGLPFVMFSQKPYNAFNFTVASRFTNSVSGGIVGYPVAVGLVGLGKDAENFICARYDKVSGKAQLVKVKDAQETELVDATPGFTVNDDLQIQFSHRDGNFKVYLYNDATDKFVLVIDYDWQDADGYMCASLVSSLKCGLYGMIGGPMVQTLGLNYGSSDSGTNADGIAIAPMEDISDFPSSGNIRIGRNIYSYSSKISPPSYVRGPSQYRAAGRYSPPHGNGSFGLQCRDLDWQQSDGLLAGYLISASGYTFVSTGTNWKPSTTNAGVRVYLPNRSQHYSANGRISTFPGSLSTRVWVSGGFNGIGLVSGVGGSSHTLRDWARLELSGTIKCHWFMGAGGETNQTTIQDLLKSICSLSGIPTEFPGNFTDASSVISGETLIYEDEYAEGFDMVFDIDAPASFEIRANIKIKPDNYEEEDAISLDTGITVSITDDGGGDYILSILSTPSDTEMFSMAYSAGDGYQKFRILFHEDNMSLFQCNKWITTVTFDELIYSDSVIIKGYHATSVTFNNVEVRELADLREAVYIDLETDGASAMQSVIQERPIEVIYLPNGGIQFFYEYNRPSSTLALAPEAHNETRKIPNDAASDAIVYGSVNVVTLQFTLFAKILGLATKLFRLPDLNVGAVEAATRLLRKAYQRRKITNLSLSRPQLAPLIGERLLIDYDLAGLNKNVTGDIIIESASLSFQNSGREVDVSMSISGREYSV